PGKGETALVEHDALAVPRDDDRVDEHEVVLLLAGGAEDEHALAQADLRRGESDTLALPHAAKERRDQVLETLVEGLDGLRDLPQDRIGVEDDFELELRGHGIGSARVSILVCGEALCAPTAGSR